MSDEEEIEETADEWREEAGKWKQRAADAERAAAENAGAVERLAQVEKSTREKAAEYAEQVEAVKAEAEQAAKAAEERGEKTAAEWRVEAEKWKQLSQKNEQLAKQNLAAAKRLEKLEAEKATAAEKAAKVEEQTAETKADLEAKATAAQLKAMRLAVAQELGVPTSLVDLLSGSSKREIEQSADKLLRELAANKPPEPEAVEAVKAQQQAKEDSELAEARKALAEAEVKALRLEVATEKQLPPGLAELLNARTREDLEKQAEALLGAIGGARPAEQSTRARMPTERLRSGALPAGATDPDIDYGKLADSILRTNRGY